MSLNFFLELELTDQPPLLILNGFLNFVLKQIARVTKPPAIEKPHQTQIVQIHFQTGWINHIRIFNNN